MFKHTPHIWKGLRWRLVHSLMLLCFIHSTVGFDVCFGVLLEHQLCPSFSCLVMLNISEALHCSIIPNNSKKWQWVICEPKESAFIGKLLLLVSWAKWPDSLKRAQIPITNTPCLAISKLWLRLTNNLKDLDHCTPLHFSTSFPASDWLVGLSNYPCIAWHCSFLSLGVAGALI